jgi:hypothetical protein
VYNILKCPTFRVDTPPSLGTNKDEIIIEKSAWWNIYRIKN